ncbi:MAG: BspA family leucine-rich repeat surface protein [Firmicutes bacterium]|nr:BspA family leucine-rich repeat surface protein [Bacillota bacterium]
MKNKYVKILIIIAAFLVLSLVTSASYAYFVANVQGNENSNNTVITTGDVSLYVADDGVVRLSNAYPTQYVEKVFGITNIGSATTTYNVYLSNIINTFADKNDLVYTIRSIRAPGMYQGLTQVDGCANSNERVVPSIVGEESNIISSCQINPGELQLYVLTITFKDDGTNQDDNKGKKFAALVSVNDYYDNLEQTATIETGLDLNRDLRMLAGDPITNIEEYDENIQRIEFSSTAPTEEDKFIYVEGGDTTTDIKAWFKNGTIYIYSSEDTIYLPSDSSHMFAGMKNLTYVDLSHFDTSNVTKMVGMFKNDKSITSIDLTNFDTSNVTDMEGIFAGCGNVEHIYFGENFNTSNVENMRSVFQNTYALREVDLSHFDTSKVTSMAWMFCASGIVSLDLSSFDTSNVTSMRLMIANMDRVSSINLGENFDTSKVTDMFHMFRNIRYVTTLDLGNKFSVEKADDVSGMFMQEANQTALVTIKSNKDLVFKNDALNDKVFYKTTVIVGGKGTVYKTNNESTNGYKYAVIDCGTKRPGYLTYSGTAEEYEQFCSQFD